MTALGYAEAIDAYCLRDWHYASTALAGAAITQADLQATPAQCSRQAGSDPFRIGQSFAVVQHIRIVCQAELNEGIPCAAEIFLAQSPPQ
jgi:hypothetical protein